jgi:muramoyltetrapeptide carboxypeptidase
MIIPPFLKFGDKIGICATARFVTAEGIQPSLNHLKNWGLEPVLGNNIFKKHFQFGGMDEERAEDFQYFLDNPDIKAILIAKGGYGTVRVIDKIDFTNFSRNPKWICGFSDITVIHSHIHQNTGVATLHSPMAMNFPTSEILPPHFCSFKDFLFGKWPSFSFENNFSSKNRQGAAVGKLVGGNLSLLYSLTQSTSDLDLTGKILFIEDIDEYLYHIDRMMLQLFRTGKLSKISGLVVGGFSAMRDNDEPFGKSAEDIILESTTEFSFPVAFGLPVGHLPINFPLPLGVNVELKVGERSSEMRYLV